MQQVTWAPPARQERRQAARHRKRIKVVFGTRDREHTGFTADISSTGMFIQSRHVFSVGTLLSVRIIGHERDLCFAGRVVRSKHVPPVMRGIERGGMGICFLTPEQLVSMLLPQSAPPPVPRVVEIRNETDLGFVISGQLQRGICVVPVEGTPPAHNSTVSFEIRTYLDESSPVACVGRVVQILEIESEGRGGLKSMVLELRDAAAVCNRLQDLLAAKR